MLLTLLLFPFISIAQTREFKGETQSEINFNASIAYKLVDSTMNSIYQLSIAKRKDDKLLVKNLKISQASWIKWRDFEIKAFYPEYPEKDFYGSMQPVCYYSKLIDWTEERIKQLNIYLHGVDKYDLCSPGKE